MEGNSAGQAFGGLVQKGGRGAAHHEEPGGQRPPIGQHPQRREDIRPALHLVENDQTLERAQRELGVGQERDVRGTLEVEAHAPSPEAARDLPSEGRLSDLAGAQQSHHGETPKASLDGLEVRIARYLHDLDY
jgi:hypothetical protein